MIFFPFPFNEALYDICSWLKHGGLPVIVLDQGRFPPQMLPLLEEQPSLSLMSGTEKTLSVWGPEPGAWYLVAGYTGPHITEQTHTCHPMMSLMAEYLIETDIITVIPTFYNYQDIRTFYTVNTTQTFKARHSNNIISVFKFTNPHPSSLCRLELSVVVLTSLNAVCEETLIAFY